MYIMHMHVCAKYYNYVCTVSYQVQDGVYFIRTSMNFFGQYNTIGWITVVFRV